MRPATKTEARRAQREKTRVADIEALNKDLKLPSDSKISERVVGQMEKGWREEVGLVTGSLRKKLVNFYVDAVDGYDDTTA